MSLSQNLKLGTSSWSSKDWLGVFYPEGTKPEHFIEYYSGVFDAVEIDATFYRMPTMSNITAWRERTPEEFTFCAKVPKIITHDKMLVDADDDMTHFIQIMSKLDTRLGPLLLQFPYFNKQKFSSAERFLDRLDRFLSKLPTDIRYAVEIRNKAWLKQPLFDVCCTHNAALAWIEQAWMPDAGGWSRLKSGLTTDFAYVRWLGDHKGIERITKTWDRTVIDRTDTLKSWVPVIQKLESMNTKVFGFFNNHFAGHAPSSLELFRTLYGNNL